MPSPRNPPETEAKGAAFPKQEFWVVWVVLIAKHVPLPATSLDGVGRDTSVLTADQNRRAKPLYRQCTKPSHPASHSPHWLPGRHILRGNGQELGVLPDPENTLTRPWRSFSAKPKVDFVSSLLDVANKLPLP